MQTFDLIGSLKLRIKPLKFSWDLDTELMRCQWDVSQPSSPGQSAWPVTAISINHYCWILDSYTVPPWVAIGLSLRYETQPPIGWYHHFVIGWSKYWLALPSAPVHYGLRGSVGIPNVFQTQVTVPLHSPNSRQLPAVRVVQGDCERVYLSTMWGLILHSNHWINLALPRSHMSDMVAQTIGNLTAFSSVCSGW